MLAPHFSNGVSYQVLENVAPVSIWTQHGYPTDYEMAPRFWLGYEGYNGLGVRARYMQFDHDLLPQTITTDATTTVFFDGVNATGGEELSFSTAMELHVLDFDVTQDFEVWSATLTAGAGLRYANLRYEYAATVIDGVTQEMSTGYASFEEVGPFRYRQMVYVGVLCLAGSIG